MNLLLADEALRFLRRPGRRLGGLARACQRLAQGVASHGARLGLLLIWTATLSLAVPLNDAVRFGGDEGVELVKAAHLLRGGAMDETVWNDQPLVQTRLYAVLMKLHGGALLPRLWSVACSVMLLVSMSALASALVPRPGVATLALWLLAFAPLVFELSISAMQEIPATAFGLASAAVAARCGHSPTPARVTVAATLAAVAMSIKLTAALYAAAATLLILSAPRPAGDARRSQGRTRAALLHLLLALVGLLGLLAVFDGRPVADLLAPHAVSFVESRAAEPPSQSPATRILGAAPCLLLFACVGAIRICRERGPASIGRALILPILAVAWNASIQPWWKFYSISIWAGLAPLAAFGVARVLEQASAAIRRDRLRSARTVALGAMALVAVGMLLGGALEWARSVAAERQTLRVADSRVLRELEPYLGDSPRTGYSTDPIYMFWAGIRVPPDLMVVTRKRFLSGDLRREQFPDRVAARGCDIVLAPIPADPDERKTWETALSRDYALVRVIDGFQLHVRHSLGPKPFHRTFRWP